jgi:hypothetical protein
MWGDFRVPLFPAFTSTGAWKRPDRIKELISAFVRLSSAPEAWTVCTWGYPFHIFFPDKLPIFYIGKIF